MGRRRAACCCAILLALFLSGCVRLETRRAQTEPRARDEAGESDPVRVSAEKTEAAEPSAASAHDGTVYVAWVEHRGKEADVWLAHFDGEGRRLGEPARVNPNAGEATAWRGDPPTIAVAHDGTVYVGWTARDETAPHASRLYLSASRDGGRGFAAPTKVNDEAKPGVHGMHSLAVSADGRVYVAWLDERDIEPVQADASKAPSHMHTESNRFVYFASSSDGGRTFSPNRRVAGEVCPCCKTSLAVGEDGRVYVSWRQVLPGNFRHVAVASSNDGGQTISSPVVVSDDRWEIQACPVSGPALLAAGGSLRVLWYTAGEAGMPGFYWSESVDGGHTFSPRKVLAETSGRGTPALLKSEGGLSAVWEGSDGAAPAAFRARLDGDGSAAAAVVATGGELPAAAETAGQLFVAYVAKDGEGRGVWLVKSRK